MGSFAGVFADYLRRRSLRNRIALQEEIKRFVAHFAYLELIANANGLQPFDRNVAEAFWIGNGLLKNVRKKDLQRLVLEKFTGKGKLSPARAKKLAEKMPDGFLPHHTFHVLYLHTITGVIEPSVENAERCRVGWGSVKKVGRGFAVVDSQKLAERKGKLLLVPCSRKVLTQCAGIDLLPELQVGDLVAIHWEVAVMKIGKLQLRRLESVTGKNIEIANRA